MSNAPNTRGHAGLTLAIGAGLVLGLAVGPLLGPAAAPLGDLGKLVIQLIKAIATPLLFLAVLNGVLRTEVGARSGARMFFFSGINAIIAVTIGLALSNAFRPGDHLAAAIPAHDAAKTQEYADRQFDLIKTIGGYVPTDLISPFSGNVVLTIIGIAILGGLALRRVKAQQLASGSTAYRSIEDAIDTLLSGVQVALGWVVMLVPVAVFGVVAKTVGQYGFAPMRGLAAYLVIGLLGLSLQVLITYQLWIGLWARIGLTRFWAAARDPVVYGLGSNSSLATLPLTLGALRRLRVSEEAATVGACVGTNFNNDGILLYEGMAVLFVAQAHGIDLSLGQQLFAAGTCVVAAMGVAGVPEAGIVSLAIVLNAVGLPLELLPLLLTVDWVIARGRTAVNVLSDMVLSILIDGRNRSEIA